VKRIRTLAAGAAQVPRHTQTSGSPLVSLPLPLRHQQRIVPLSLSLSLSFLHLQLPHTRIHHLAPRRELSSSAIASVLVAFTSSTSTTARVLSASASAWLLSSEMEMDPAAVALRNFIQQSRIRREEEKQGANASIYAAVSPSQSCSPDLPSQPRRPRKVEKKALTRRTRAYGTICSAEGKTADSLFSLSPTRHVYVCNGGASAGVAVRHEQLLTVMERYGKVERITQIVTCPFAIVEFKDVSAAMRAVAALDGEDIVWPDVTEADTSSSDGVSSSNHSGSPQPNPPAQTLFLEYAQAEESAFLGDQPHPLQLPNARSLEHISPVSVCSLDEMESRIASGRLSEGIVPGLLLVHDFISEEEESQLMEYFESQPWDTKKLRSVQHYGYAFRYGLNNIDRGSPLHEKKMPDVVQSIIERMKPLRALDDHRRIHGPSAPAAASASTSAASSSLSLSASGAVAPAPASSSPHFLPEQLTVNKYQPGDGIPHHVDTHAPFTGIIVSISLQSTLVMELAPIPPHAPVTRAIGDTPPLIAPPESASAVHLPLPRRSMLCLSGAARYGYTHAIAPRRIDRMNYALQPRSQRTSMTFRQIRPIQPGHNRAICTCAWRHACDTPDREGDTDASSEGAIPLQYASNAATQDHPSFASASASSSPTPLSTTSSTSAAADSFLMPPPPPSVTLSPAIEELHRSACEAGQSTYTDPDTGYSVFTALGLQRIRKGVCCGNRCRHCPYQHANVK